MVKRNPNRAVVTVTGLKVRGPLEAMIPELLDAIPGLNTVRGKYRLTLERVHERKQVLSADGCVRLDDDGKPWLLNKRAGGWGSLGYQYSSWGELLDEWNIGIGAPETDKHGTYWPIIPREKL